MIDVWLIVDPPWVGGPEFYKKADQQAMGEQVNKQHHSMASLCFCACPDFPQCWRA